MSTITTPGGPVIGVAVLRIPVVPESDTHAHNAQHAQVVHQHVNVDVPESFSAKNIQVSPNGTFIAGMPAGIVTEFATVTGKLDVIDDAYINVQPDPDKHETSVLVGFDYNKGQSDEHTGVYVHRNHDIIVMSHKDGIRAPKHLIEGHNMEAIHFDAQHVRPATKSIPPRSIRLESARTRATKTTQSRLCLRSSWRMAALTRATST